MTDVPPHATLLPRQGLAFLELGERLRQRGQLDAAVTVAQAGLVHYPDIADAHDLLGRIRADQGNPAAAVAAWQAALACDTNHPGAHKGLAFLAYRAGDLAGAERQLELVVAHTPHDATVLAALDRIRLQRRRAPVIDTPALEEPGSGLLLYDMDGMRLAGMAEESADSDLADVAAAAGAGLSREAARLVRLLELGDVQQIVLESAAARVAVVPVGSDAALLLHRTTAVPLGRLLALAARAARTAHHWLEQIR